MANYDTMVEGVWSPIVIGDDSGVQRMRARVVWRQLGADLHAWAKFRLPDGRVMMAYATTNLPEIEKYLMDEAVKKALGGHGHGAESAGWFKRKFKKLKAAVKKVAKKTGIAKVVKTVANVAKKALDNPFVQAALAATPYGAAFLVARKATKMALKAVKGSKKARDHIKQLASLAKGGNSKAKSVLDVMRGQIKRNPKLFAGMPNYKKMAAAAGEEALSLMVQGCVDYPPSAVAGAEHEYHVVAGEYFSIMGDDANGTTDQEMEAIDTLAETGGGFDGMRWLATRMSLHSMDARPDELTARGALLWGRATQANRFAHA